MKIIDLTPESEALIELGRRLATLRKQQGFSQARLAEEAGVGVATIKRIEAGQDSQLETWIKLLKAIGLVSSIDSLLPEDFASPMAEVLAERGKRRIRTTKPAEFVWGDEES